MRAGYESYQAAIAAQEKRHESSSRDLDNAAKEAASYLCAKSRGRVTLAFRGACFRKCQNRPKGCDNCFRFSNYVPKEDQYGEKDRECVEAPAQAGV